jgi:hypothetical protein
MTPQSFMSSGVVAHWSAGRIDIARQRHGLTDDVGMELLALSQRGGERRRADGAADYAACSKGQKRRRPRLARCQRS